MNKNKKAKDYQFEKIPLEINEIFSKLNIESSLENIAKSHTLDKKQQEDFVQCCQKFLYYIDLHINVLIKELRQYINTDEEKLRALGIEFIETVAVPLKKMLEEYYQTLDKDVENVFYESDYFKITDQLVHYSKYPSSTPPQPISMVSNITNYRNLWRTRYTVTFEVWIPEKGRWGTVDRPGITFINEKEAIDFIDILKKAIACGKIRSLKSA